MPSSPIHQLLIERTVRVSRPGAVLQVDRIDLTPVGRSLLCARPWNDPAPTGSTDVPVVRAPTR